MRMEDALAVGVLAGPGRGGVWDGLSPQEASTLVSRRQAGRPVPQGGLKPFAD